MKPRTIFLAAGAVIGLSAPLVAAPAYIEKAVSDSARPATDTARDAARKPAEMLAFAGVRPGQVVVMVTCWVAAPAVIAGAIAAPAAVALNTATVHAMAATAHTGIPASFTNVFPVPRLALLSLAALVLAVLGALLPAAWAARARAATALRAE